MIIVNIIENLMITVIIEGMEVKLIVKVMKGSGEYMTEKRFIIPNQMRVIRDTVTGEEAIFYDAEDGLLLKEWLNNLYDENEQLKQRNNRQAKQLDRLYRLIEEKDWRALSDIIDDFKRCDEQLQREWGNYSV